MDKYVETSNMTQNWGCIEVFEWGGGGSSVKGLGLASGVVNHRIDPVRAGDLPEIDELVHLQYDSGCRKP